MNKVKDAYRRVFDSEDGRVVFRDLLKRGFVTKPCSSVSDAATREATGMQRLILSIGRYAYGRTAEELIQQTIESQVQDEMDDQGII